VTSLTLRPLYRQKIRPRYPLDRPQNRSGSPFRESTCDSSVVERKGQTQYRLSYSGTWFRTIVGMQSEPIDVCNGDQASFCVLGTEFLYIAEMNLVSKG
jgi:hypothetical protein